MTCIVKTHQCAMMQETWTENVPALDAVFFQDVKFTMSLDVYDLCTPELQAKLQPARDKFKELEDKKAEEMIQVIPLSNH